MSTINLTRSSQLPKKHAGSPLMTNAALNRNAACKCAAAGMTAQQIASEWPEVWACTPEGKLSQKYDYELADGSGRFETNRRITDDSVRKAIHKYSKKSA